ncbi:MAG: hypothetical protein M1812_006346 [Candelaria pacifica]|nr:MAG: hypothetical protein M1812_006346 [Candelaria pacifica]
MALGVDSNDSDRPFKRRRVEVTEVLSGSETQSEPDSPTTGLTLLPEAHRNDRESQSALSTDQKQSLTSLGRPITPPQGRMNAQGQAASLDSSSVSQTKPPEHKRKQGIQSNQSTMHSSPFQLTRIRDLAAPNNVDTVGIKDILGDPLIKECWQFNYLFDIDFLMSAFDEDVRNLVQVKVVHGSWKKEDPRRIYLLEAAKQYPNIQLITAYMPEPFGTHHSKMMILIRHDGYAQVVIHTANIVPPDWTNMCQAVWRSPLLPLVSFEDSNQKTSTIEEFGSGDRFKFDLLAYLRAYGKAKTGSITDQLKDYDFSSIRAALIASTPCKQKISLDDLEEPMWGWPSLRRLLRTIPSTQVAKDERAHIIVQISSIATLGQTDKWLAGSFLSALSSTSASTASAKNPKVSIIFPTADEIRRSLDGYQSGTSIHMRLQSAAQAKQLSYMRPMFCHWAGDGAQQASATPATDKREAGRRRAAPHIKTYIRFTDSSMTSIDWAMVTSANLSTQAWGAAANVSGEVRICSWEIGVVVWPGLWAEDGNAEQVDMVPVFKQDTPVVQKVRETALNGDSTNDQPIARTVMGLRMPYDLPLVPYGDDDLPWCATSNYTEPDWMGHIYGGFHNS